MDMYKLNQVPSEAQIRKYLRRIIFGKNVFCPACRSRKIIIYEHRYRCRRCRKKFSLLSHTWLSGMKIPLQQFWLILWCFTQQVPVKQTTVLCHQSEKAIRHWFHLFRVRLPEQEEILRDIVQLDEAYFKKTALLLGKQVGSRKLAWVIQDMRVGSVDKHLAATFLQQHVRPQTQLQSDGSAIYKRIEEHWPVVHKVDIHKKFQFGLTSEIEGMFGNLRTFIRRMYHHSSQEHLPEYVSEFCVRFSSPEIFTSPNSYLSKTLTLVPIG